MTEPRDPSRGDRRSAIAGSIPFPPRTNGPVKEGVDAVEQEWERIERERLEGEVAEAREDVIEAIVHPGPVARGGAWVWWAFAVALVAGAAFAAGVNLFFMPTVRDAGGGPVAAAPRPPTETESGPGFGAAFEEARGDGDRTEAPTAVPSP